MDVSGDLGEARRKLREADEAVERAKKERQEAEKAIKEIYDKATPEDYEKWSSYGPPRLTGWIVAEDAARHAKEEVERALVRLRRKVWLGFAVALLAGLGGNIAATGLDRILVGEALNVALLEVVSGGAAVLLAALLALGFVGAHPSPDVPN
jgi:hypothetical protein